MGVTKGLSQVRPCSLLCLFCGLLLLSCAQSRCAAADFIESFEANETTWNIDDSGGTTLRAHSRQAQVQAREGKRAELLSLLSNRSGGSITLSHPLRPARVIHELTVSLWIRSTRPGAIVWLRVIFPNEVDPESGTPLHTLIQGDSYTTAGNWQQLRCSTTDKLIQNKIVLERARLKNPQLNYRDLYVDRVLLTMPVSSGPIDLLLDDLHFGPIVDPRPETRINPSSFEQAEPSSPAVDLRGGRLEVNGRPFLPRITPWHGESVDTLKQAGINVALIPSCDDATLLSELRSRGMWAMAEPPCAVSETGKILDAKSAGILPFAEGTSPILIWYLGTQIPAEMRQKLIPWKEQIRHADRRFQRPIAADVNELEQVYSRHLDLLSASRHTLNTTFSLKDYRKWLEQKRQLANPWTYLWTWIQTEPVGANTKWRQEQGKALIVTEPEQIRLQVYAALSAGCRAIGFWKRTSLEGNAVGNEERRLIISMLGMELDLLEPWLAAGVVSEIVPFSVALPEKPSINRKRIDPARKSERQQLLSARQAEVERIKFTNTELEAAIINSSLGTLVLPVWYERNAQFVPGKMAAYDAKIVVPGVDESARAFEVTPAGIRSLDRERVPGGVKITLKQLDMTAMIVLSSDVNLREMLEAKIREMAADYARAGLQLAKAKLARVQTVDAELQELGVGQPDARYILESAHRQIESAELSLEKSDYDSAREQSAAALQQLRTLQRTHWDRAKLKLFSPVSSPYAVSFQTLPDHWRMVSQIGRSNVDSKNNLMPSGNFENQEAVVADWSHSQNEISGIRATAELYPVSHKGSYSLRLVAVPETGVDTPAVVSQSPVTVTTPSVQVRAGQLIHVGGWIRVATPVSGSLDGVMLSDSLTGTVGALRWRDKTDWQWFDMIREVREAGDFSLTLSLQGLGEAQFDDLRIVPIDSPTDVQPASKNRESDDRRPDMLRFLNPWQNKKPNNERTASEKK